MLAVAVAVRLVAVFRGTDVPEVGAVIATVGATPFTVTETPVDVVVVVVTPSVWVATAVKVTAPAAEGVQTTEYGIVVSTAIEVLPAKNSTRVIASPVLGDALAVIVVAAPTDVIVAFAGDVIATVGAAATTDTFTIDELTTMFAVSVTCAVSATAPRAFGVHDTEYGATVAVGRIATPLAKNATCVTVAPVLGEAVAVTWLAALIVTEEPFAGAETATLETLVAAVTGTGVERTALPLSSTACARNE